MRNFKSEIETLDFKMKEIKTALKSAEKFTQDFLNKCGDAGIKIVSIGQKSDKVEATKNFPFSCGGSVFSEPKGVRDGTGWPAIWGIVSQMGISGGAGNSDQHQVANDDLIQGVYELKGKTWRRIE